jgi:hypothetical protein
MAARLGGVSVAVTVYTWPPGGGQIAINELHSTMFDLPPVGSRRRRRPCISSTPTRGKTS